MLLKHFDFVQQVSYVILNGTTWGLEVKGLGRDKRSITQNTTSSEQVIDFIDTRDIPDKLSQVLTPRKRPKPKGKLLASSHIKKRKGRNREQPRFQTKHIDKNSKVSISKNVLSKAGVQSTKPKQTDGKVHHKKTKPKPVDQTNSESKISNDEIEKSKRKSIVKSILSSKKKNKIKKIKNEYYDDNNKLKNATSIKDEPQLTNPEKTLYTLNSTNVSKMDKIEQSQQSIKTSSEDDETSTKKTLTKKDHESILRQAIKEEMERILQQKQLREKVRKAIQAQLKNDTSELNDTKVDPAKEKIVIVDQSNHKSRKSKNLNQSQNIIKVSFII